MFYKEENLLAFQNSFFKIQTYCCFNYVNCQKDNVLHMGEQDSPRCWMWKSLSWGMIGWQNWFFWILELLLYLKLITRHQKPSNFEDKCFCATASATACAHKAHTGSMLVSKQMSWAMQSICACRMTQTNLSRWREGGRRGSISSIWSECIETSWKTNAQHMWPFGKCLCATASTTCRMIKSSPELSRMAELKESCK